MLINTTYEAIRFKGLIYHIINQEYEAADKNKNQTLHNHNNT